MIQIIADSTSYIPYEYAKCNNIKIIPLTVLFNNVEFKEGYPGSYDCFIKDFKCLNKQGKTFSPTVETIQNYFEKVLKKGDEIIFITVSSFLSEIYKNALIAKKNVDSENKISVIDSTTCCQCVWDLVRKMVALRGSGYSREEIVNIIEKTKLQEQIYFIPHDLDCLSRRGKVKEWISSFAKIFGIKTCICFNQNNITVLGKYFGINTTIKAMLGKIPKNVKTIYVMRVADSKYFKKLINKINKNFKNANILQLEVGPVMSIYTGAAIGVGFLK